MLNIPDNFWIGVIGSIMFGIVGIVLELGGYKVFDKMLYEVDFQKKLNENPIALAIVIASFFVSIAMIVSACVQ